MSLGLTFLVLASVPWNVLCGMEVDLYVHKDKFGKSLTLDIGDKECTNVPRLWANLTQSVNTHGSCMQFYDRKNCKGRIAVIQPFHTVHQMDLSLINFHNTIESVSPCGAKVPSGRYVIQSAVDASMLTVQKGENDFARVNTLPPQSFIPKAQQWEISEKQPNEYDVMPRIHETNYPVTYDGDSMKKGSFVRKVWKIESVGRGRYIIKSEWTQKCLYKTRIRTVEEHDCRAWSPNQEWVLRPLIAPTQPPPTQDPQLADGVNFQVPSRVVDKYLNEQKRLREKENKNKNRDKNDDHVGAFLEPYKIRHKKNKPSTSQQEESSEEETPVRYRNGLRNGLRQAAPPGPEIMYSRPSGLFPYEPRPHGILGQKVITYMDGISPIYEDAKVEDPTFPNFLLHAASNSDEEDSPTRYAVTRRPFQPEPTGHPDYVPDKKKYDGRDKDKNYTPPKLPTGEESAEGEVQSEEKQSSEKKSSEEEEEEDEDQRAKPGHFGYSNSSPTQISATTPTPNASSSTTPSSDGDGGEKSDESGEDEEEEDETSQEDQKKPAEEDIDLGDDDPARDVAGFMKLLFQGINNRISKPDKKTTDVLQDLLIK